MSGAFFYDAASDDDLDFLNHEEESSDEDVVAEERKARAEGGGEDEEDSEVEDEDDEEEEEDEKTTKKGSTDAQSPWDFASYSSSVGEEHARRHTTSIDEKISKAIKHRPLPISTEEEDEEDVSDAQHGKQVKIQTFNLKFRTWKLKV